MTEAAKQPGGKFFGKAILISTYIAILLCYAMVGAIALSQVFPNFYFALLMVVSAFAGMKLDYRFRGPALRVEKRYAEYTSKVKE